MKILLAAVNAKYIHSNLAVYSLKAYAESCGYPVEMCEYTINQPKDGILKDIYKQKADAIFFSCYIWNIDTVSWLIENLHKVSPELPIFLGGPEVSFDAPKRMEQFPFLAGVLVGEGEKTFVKLLEEGSFTSGAQKIYETIPVDMDELPFVYEKMNLDELQHRIIYYESSRGCPFSCSYCLSSVDKHLRFRSLDLVKKELQFFLDRKVPQVKFVDRTFNCNKNHAGIIWSYIREHDNGVTNFHFEIGADLITDEQIELLAAMRPGLVQLEIGVQSTNPETLREIRRSMDFDQLSQVVKQIQAGENIHQHLDLIAGLPFEEYPRFIQSFNDVYDLMPNQLQLGFLKVLKGSHMHQVAQSYECKYHGQAPYEVLSTKWMDYDHILILKSVDKMVDIYYNSGQFTTCLPILVKAFPSPFDFYRMLGQFYEAENYELISHSRIRRYDILLEFAQACNHGFGEDRISVDVEELKEAMTMDLYLREPMKKVPAWAVNIKDKYEFDYEDKNPMTGNARVCQRK